MATIDLEKHGLVAPAQRPEIPGAGPQTVADVLDATLALDPEREALVGRGARYTYRELDAAVKRAANALAGLGVAPGDRVAACLPNDTEIVVAFLATQRLGALWVGVNRVLATPEKVYILADSEASIFLTEDETAAQLVARRQELPALHHVLRADPGDASSDWARALGAASEAPLSVEIDPFAPAAIAYTSGTTGFPKGAVHCQHNLLVVGAVSVSIGAAPAEERIGVMLPLTILNLMVLGPITAYQVGTCLVAMDRIDAVGVAEWVREEGVNSFATVPTVIHDLLTHPDVKPADLVALVRPLVGGAECPEEFREIYRARFGREVSLGYGMTEAPTAVTYGEGGQYEPGQCGAARPQIELSIRDSEGRSLAPGEVGEICVAPARRGEWAGVYTPMLGYWNKPEATAEALADGVFHTGDLGFLDASGELTVRGRIKELILRGGANVYPAEVERVICGDPRVADCAVLGRPDERLGERVAAVVQRQPGAEITAEEIRERCLTELARYKVPDFVLFIDELPRNAMNKVVKPRLRELVEA
ncbi:MAG: AMP-binding protein [Myxococcota bacterium]